ncbi:MAG TPA: aminomethyl-transferring glycine dehydrogenase subunit GcvPA [Holophagaceae bacterium]|nr:aminomethyl-transferring glycine dehydrogenase subunit GcvPA [Holophagaceae bacterium]
MRYLPSAPSEDRELLDAIGVSKPEELLKGVPEHLRLARPLNLPPTSSELEVLRDLEKLADMNARFRTRFLGAGAYAHFIPSAVDHQISRQEWFTAYTPYQPEISQGTLQHIFEYQTIICDLTGLDVTNASLYDGGTACLEAALMAVRVQRKRGRVLVSEGLHPHYREVLRSGFASHEGLELVEVKLADGVTDPVDLAAKLDETVAGVLVGYPNFLGAVEDLKALSDLAHAKGALLVSVTQESMAFGWLEAPGKVGADMACGEAMSFGNKTSFGGPFLGFLAVKDAHKREIPGRVVGQTKDLEGRTGYVLTLTAREQHIRRDKATSNICSNQGLIALRANIFLQLAGPEGLRGLAGQNAAKAQYLKARLLELPDWEEVDGSSFFNEFVLRHKGDLKPVFEALQAEGILPGLDLTPHYPEYRNCVLWCATEINTRTQIEHLIEVLARVASVVG